METAKLNQLIYFKNVFTLRMLWGRSHVFVSTGNSKLWFPSKLIEFRFDWGRTPEDFGYKHEDKSQKDYRTGDIYADPSAMGRVLRLDETW